MFFKKLIFILFFTLMLLYVTKPLFYEGYFPIHDDIQTMRVHQMDKCIRDGQIPCRWVPDMGYGYGYPQFNYYAPLPYYFMEIPHLFGSSVIDSVKIGFFVSFIISVLGMFFLGRELWGKWGGLLSSVFYLYLPYRAVNVYVRGAMGEVWAMSILPFVFLFIYKVIRGDKKSLLGFALSLAALVTSHNVTTLIFAPFAIIWVLYCYFHFTSGKKLSLKPFRELLFGGLWSISLSSFFLLPAWFEKSLVHVDSITMGYFNFLAHFVGFKQLLFSSFWGYGASELGNYDDMLLSIGVLWWAVPIVALFWLYYFNIKNKTALLLFVTMGVVSLFMIHPKSTPIWLSIPILSYVQFPWRFLSIAGFVFSLAAGSMVLLIPKSTQVRNFFLVVFGSILVLFYSGNFRPSRVIDVNDEQKFSGESWRQQQTISIFDYLPIFADFPPTNPAQDSITVVGGEVLEIASKNGSDWKAWNLEVVSETAKLSLPIIYFPDWKVFDNSEPIGFDIEEKIGVMTVILNSGNHFLEARLFDTPVRKFGNILTFLSVLIIPIYLYGSFRKLTFRK